jgi:hypothetical protein
MFIPNIVLPQHFQNKNDKHLYNYCSYYYFKISIAWARAARMQESTIKEETAVVRMQKTSVMLLQTTDSAMKMTVSLVPTTQAFGTDHLSTSASPVIVQRKLARLWLHRLPITLPADKPVTPPSIMTLNQMTRPVQSVVPAYYHWNSSPVQQWNSPQTCRLLQPIMCCQVHSR